MTDNLTVREAETVAMLAAAAQTIRVDTDTLWRKVEAEVEGHRGRHTRRPGVLLAAAASAAVAGAVIWAGGMGSTPLAPSSTPAPTATVTTDAPTTSAPTASAPSRVTTSGRSTALPSTALRPLSTTSVLTADDFRAAGWAVDEISAAAGFGQAAISSCQDDHLAGAEPGITAVFRSDGYGAGTSASQIVAQFGDAADATQTMTAVLDWGKGCADSNPGSGSTVVTSGPAVEVELPGEGEGYWYSLSAGDRAELVAVARSGDRLSVAVLSDLSGSGQLDGADATVLVQRAVQRLR
jgi:hypothetical protein